MARPARFAASAALVLGVSLLVTSCGGSTLVNATKLEQSIRSTLDKDPLTPVRSVSCPHDVASVAGKRFTCTIETPAGAQGVVSVTVRDSHQHVRWSLTQPPAPDSGVLARMIRSDFSAHDHQDAVSATTCPETVTLAPGAKTVCTITLTSGQRVRATVIRSPGGGISWTYVAG